jgi:hypothetical protein
VRKQRASQIDQIKKAAMQSTLKNKSKTRQGMLPQSLAPKVSIDDKGKVKPCTIETRSLAEQAGFQHDRGERSQEPSPAKCRKTPTEHSGVTRVFVLAKDGTQLMPCHAARARELIAKDKAVVVRRYPFFNLQTKSGRVPDISHKHCRIIQRADGYGYQPGETAIHPLAKANGPLA